MIKAELLTPIDEQALITFARNPDYGFQEKHDGDRVLVEKKGSDFRTYNRDGEPTRPLSPLLQRTLLATGIDFIIDTERMPLPGESLVILDLIGLMGHDITGLSYAEREAFAHQAFGKAGACIKVIHTVEGEESKLTFAMLLHVEKKEGVVVRDMRRPYRPGRAKQHFKLKFVKELDAVVIGPSPDGKDSVRIGVYDGGKMHEVSGVSLRNKFTLSPNDVVTVRFLCVTKDMKIREPRIVRQRFDKKASDCTLGQLRR